ncbi:MAG TPA: hypothetical protein VFY73_17805 [Ideonella sp.]|uniref:hypothetical protein n=1 Tax=Ideonella sp. TaxID=1929293 RepID=UPI002E35F92E|nr:hypothetical protein [Ideonella sp.]HEX5685883.1 hypothetical protein [Ideonella sp.]
MTIKATTKEQGRRSGRLQAAGRTLATRLLVDAWFGAGAPMTIQQDIAALRIRIGEVQAACDAWRVAGPKEKYLEAYFLIEALTLQLDECLKHLPDELATS